MAYVLNVNGVVMEGDLLAGKVARAADDPEKDDIFVIGVFHPDKSLGKSGLHTVQMTREEAATVVAQLTEALSTVQ